MFLLINFSVFALNMQVLYGQGTCDCSEIKLLKEIVQGIVWEQKVESAKLAELDAWRMSNQMSPGTANKDIVDRLASMEREITDVNVRLEQLIKEEDNADKERMEVVLKKTITSEKQERLDFVSDVKSQMTQMVNTIENFKIEINETLTKNMEGINASGEEMKSDIYGKLKEIKDKTEDFMDTVVMNVTQKIDENMEQFTHLETVVNEVKNYGTDIQRIAVLDTVVNEVKKHVKDIQHIAVTEKVDGKWSNWSRWSSCSVSCGSGNRYRERSCSNPQPSVLGKQCEGSNRQTDSCAPEQCRDEVVAFHAYGIRAGSSASDVPTFPTAIVNFGNDYDSSSGIFTCAVPGIYHFAVTLSIKVTNDNTLLNCFLNISSKKKLDIYVRLRDGDSSDIYPATATGVFYLFRGDTVKISECDKYGLVYNDQSTNFMGFLVAPYG